MVDPRVEPAPLLPCAPSGRINHYLDSNVLLLFYIVALLIHELFNKRSICLEEPSGRHHLGA